MLSRCSAYAFVLSCALSVIFPFALCPQRHPAASSASILLLPKRVVSGEPATLAVLDVNGRLTPGVPVNFSNGDHLVTNATGRALFVAPLNPGVIYATISSRPGRVYATILTPAEVRSSSLRVSSAPSFASLTDRFELFGSGFCGEADSNKVRVAGNPPLVLPPSPAALVVLPPADLESGPAVIEASCAKPPAPPFSITFLAFSLDADSSPLAPSEHRTLTVHISGPLDKIPLEPRNLSPAVAELTAGNPARISSSGRADHP